MKLIVGLGNIGKAYERTRHNAGFMCIDELAKKCKVSFDKEGFKAIYTSFNYHDEKIILAKPTTYMNCSGEAVVSLMNFYKLKIEDLIVLHDDLDLPLGKLRIRYQGSCGGQNGMRNIIDLLGNSQIKRFRIGIGHDRLIDTKDYVLGKLSKEDMEVLKQTFDKATEALVYSFDHDFQEVMSKFN